MKKMINTTTIIGKVYQHSLEMKTVKNQNSANFGKPFISGVLEVAVDEEGINVIPIHYTYVAEKTSGGANNKTFSALKKIMEEGKYWITDGPADATLVEVNTALALNDFYNQSDELVSSKRNEGGFVTIISEIDPEKEINKFTFDMLITNTPEVETKEDANGQIYEGYLILKGAVFNFRNEILPISVIVKNPKGIEYFQSLDITPNNPTFIKLWGHINCMTVNKPKIEESAFGEPLVTNYVKHIREWVVTGTAKAPYEYGDENVLTSEDITRALQNREVMLAEKKQQREQWLAQKNSSPSGFGGGAMNNPIQAGTFNF